MKNRLTQYFKWTVVRAFTSALAFALILVPLTQASDHADAPNTTEGNLDVNDLYVFSHGENLVFAMTLNPFLTPGEKSANAAFNPNGLYQFKLDKERDGKEDAVIQVSFEGTGVGQKIMVRGPTKPVSMGPLKNTLVKTDAITGTFNQKFTSKGILVFAGPRDDPFFLHLRGDSSLTSVLNGVYSAALKTPVGDADKQTVAFAKPGNDDFKGTNVLAIVVEVPKSQVATALGIEANGKFFAWATTSMKD